MFINRYCLCTVFIHERLNTHANALGPSLGQGLCVVFLRKMHLKGLSPPRCIKDTIKFTGTSGA